MRKKWSIPQKERLFFFQCMIDELLDRLQSFPSNDQSFISMALTLYLLTGLSMRALRGEGVDLDAAPEGDAERQGEARRAELEGRGSP